MASGRVLAQSDSLHGPGREIGLFNHLYGTPGVRRGAAPRLGEHSAEILRELGYTPAQIDTLADTRRIKLG